MSNELVKAWEEVVIIPTYKIGQPDKNPVFLEKRVYQGSSGAVYPLPIIDKVYDEKGDKAYKAIFLENEYLKIMILPELGGRIQMAYDKTNEYHFIYHNRVIKPALVGLTGPWISGGIEFNWPQHHRPSTFDSIDFSIEANDDGSKTVWVGEIEKMNHTKGMAGYTLYPGKAYLEIKGRIYNRTPFPQSFLWWANPAVHVNENYQSVFPPDVEAVYDHGRRDVSDFPIAKGTYYKVDYSPGTDISWYKNIPVPTSYMAVDSAFDFIGGYDHGREAGILHIANHHLSPGKKQWTWGNGEFGKAWDHQLTDNDGPYIELMTGMFTDNQPDFSWLMPFEERSFTQYFMPYKGVGLVKNATIDAIINLETNNNSITIKVYTTAEQKDLQIVLTNGSDVLFKEITELNPLVSYQHTVELGTFVVSNIKLSVFDSKGKMVVSCSPIKQRSRQKPEPAQVVKDPKQIASSEGLYLAGLHLEQYRHATYSAIDYYEEALRRDSTDIRNNNALGLWFLRRGQFEKAVQFFRIALLTLTTHNSNPIDGEVHYNLGLSLFYKRKFKEAYSHFFKATWNASCQDRSYLFLAWIESIEGNYQAALEFAARSLSRNNQGLHARHFYTAILRKLERLEEAETFARESIQSDSLDFGSLNELYLVLLQKGCIAESESVLNALLIRMRGEAHTYCEIALDYARAGLFAEAIELLNREISQKNDPFLQYYIAYFAELSGKHELSLEAAGRAFIQPTGPVFSNRLEDIPVFQAASRINPLDYKALYYLGNLWYDKRQYNKAIDAWTRCVQLAPNFATVHRNLGVAYYNRLKRKEEPLSFYEKAFVLDPSDSRILFELDQLKKRLNHTPGNRLFFLDQYPKLVDQRDDLYIEYITLHNLLGMYESARQPLAKRNFHPWEGGEGKVSSQYIFTCIELAKSALIDSRIDEAITLLHEAMVFPSNLGEGKLFGAKENDINYWLGIAYQHAGNEILAHAAWEKASTGTPELSAALYYNDQHPDKIFYQGLALLKLGEFDRAHHTFLNLVDYGEQHINDKTSIDFFAVSLPDMQIFDDDMVLRNKLHCHYLLALGNMGLGRYVNASDHFSKVLELDASHQGAILHQKMLDDQSTIKRFPKENV